MWVRTKMIGLAGIEAMSRSAKAWQWEVASSQAEGNWVSIFSGLGILGCKHDISQTCGAGNKKKGLHNKPCPAQANLFLHVQKSNSCFEPWPRGVKCHALGLLRG